MSYNDKQEDPRQTYHSAGDLLKMKKEFNASEKRIVAELNAVKDELKKYAMTVARQMFENTTISYGTSDLPKNLAHINKIDEVRISTEATVMFCTADVLLVDERFNFRTNKPVRNYLENRKLSFELDDNLEFKKPPVKFITMNEWLDEKERAENYPEDMWTDARGKFIRPNVFVCFATADGNLQFGYVVGFDDEAEAFHVNIVDTYDNTKSVREQSEFGGETFVLGKKMVVINED